MKKAIVKSPFLAIGLGVLLAFGIVSLIFSVYSRPAFSDEPSTNSIAGRILSEDGLTPLSDVVVVAHHIGSNQGFSGLETDEEGNFLIPNTPAGVYAFKLIYEGSEIPVSEHFDVRSENSYLLKTCFELDGNRRNAFLMGGDCNVALPAQLVQQVEDRRLLVLSGESALTYNISMNPLSMKKASPPGKKPKPPKR